MIEDLETQFNRECEALRALQIRETTTHHSRGDYRAEAIDFYNRGPAYQEADSHDARQDQFLMSGSQEAPSAELIAPRAANHLEIQPSQERLFFKNGGALKSLA
jgi:hypothetical protein